MGITTYQSIGSGVNVKYLLIFLLALVIFVISISLGAHNDQIITFNYLLAQSEYRVSTLLVLFFVAGFALGWIICGLFYLRVRLSLARANRKIKRLEVQLEQPIQLTAIKNEGSVSKSVDHADRGVVDKNSADSIESDNAIRSHITRRK